MCFTLAKKMKAILHTTSLCLAVFLVACNRSAPQTESSDTKSRIANAIPNDLTKLEEEFIETMKNSFSHHASAPLVARVCWDGVDDSLHDRMDDYIVDGVNRGLKRFEFQRVDPKAYTKRTEGDTTTVANLPVKWLLIVYHPVTGPMEFSTEFLLGEKNGMIQITNSIVE
jgi:hypothetical protein